jgi:hypothetical protein
MFWADAMATPATSAAVLSSNLFRIWMILSFRCLDAPKAAQRKFAEQLLFDMEQTNSRWRAFRVPCGFVSGLAIVP